MSSVSARRLPRFSALIAKINHTAELAIGHDEQAIAVAVLTGGSARWAAGSDPLPLDCRLTLVTLARFNGINRGIAWYAWVRF